METLEIKSSHDLTAKSPAERREGNHSYQLNCRQFLTLERDWQRKEAAQNNNLGLMTLSFELIWIDKAEVKQVESAILAKRSSLTLD